MTPLQHRLVTILRNMDAPVTADDIRARCQLPQGLGVVDSNLRELCRLGRAIEVPPARFAHRDYQQPARDAKAAKPQAVRKPRPKAQSAAKRGLNKTERVLLVLQQQAGSLSLAMSALEISDALYDEISPNIVSGLLCTRRAAGNTPELVSHKTPSGQLRWAWCVTPPAAAPQSTESPEQEPEMADKNNAGAGSAVGVDIPEFVRGSGGVPAAVTDIDQELAVMSALDDMASRLDTRPVRDRELKVAVLDRLAAMSLPSVAALLQRIVDEDLAASEA